MTKPPPVPNTSCDHRDACPAAPACGDRNVPPCTGIEERHAAKLGLCDTLEAIADSLPGGVDRHLCLVMAATLLPTLREAHAYEEQAIFPAFARREDRAGSVRRLCAEHVEDESLAEELTETLLHIGHGGEVANPEALGFMLRALFDAMRRHIAFEREHVVPIARRSLKLPGARLVASYRRGPRADPGSGR